MKTSTKRTVSAGASVAAVGAIVLGAFTFASSVAAEPSPVSTPSPTVEVVIDQTDRADADALEQAVIDEAARVEAERVAAEAAAAEAARVEAERIAAEQAAAEQAARNSQNSGSGVPVSPPATPDPAPAPIKCPTGTVPNAVDDYGNESNCQPGDYTGGVVVP